MKKVGILTPDLLTGDAVSNDVIGMHQALLMRGYESRIFASQWGVTGITVHHLDAIDSWLNSPDSLLIYHYSIGWDLGYQVLNRLPSKKIIKYHNVTPHQFFEGINIDYVNVCRHGREQLNKVAGNGYDLYLSDSQYNSDELVNSGAGKHRNFVVPPFHQVDRLYSVQADLNFLDRFLDGKLNILMVGRIAPNKGHKSLIEAFSLYHHQYNKESRLLIVGKKDPRLSSYTDYIFDLINRNNLASSVILTDAVTDEALKSCYLLADIFAITSEHEGFCVPLVEAMSLKVPVIAYGNAAIPGTLGNAGIVWEEESAELLAESIHTLASNKSLRESLGLMGWHRYKQFFSNEVISQSFLSTLSRLQ